MHLSGRNGRIVLVLMLISILGFGLGLLHSRRPPAPAEQTMSARADLIEIAKAHVEFHAGAEAPIEFRHVRVTKAAFVCGEYRSNQSDFAPFAYDGKDLRTDEAARANCAD